MKHYSAVKAKEEYPRIAALGLTVHPEPVPHVKRDDLRKVLRKKGWTRKFNAVFGVQTMSGDGPYAWDIEATLERMISGKRTGTQLNWD